MASDMRGLTKLVPYDPSLSIACKGVMNNVKVFVETWLPEIEKLAEEEETRLLGGQVDQASGR
jgi:hypothetical protein